jgi:hypothetical protein
MSKSPVQLQGNERWVEALPSKFRSEFTAASPSPRATLNSGATAGPVRSTGGGGRTAGVLTFVAVSGYDWLPRSRPVSTEYDRLRVSCSHMVPYDQPEAALVRGTLFCMVMRHF